MSPPPSPTKPEAERKKAPNGILLTKSELIVGYLQNLALPSMGNRQLSEKDYAVWDKLLEPFSKDAIAFSFESWVRNATGSNRFPQAGVIIKLAESYQQQEVDSKKFRGCGNCIEGWLYSRNDPARYRLGMKRCSCFTAWVESRKSA